MLLGYVLVEATRSARAGGGGGLLIVRTHVLHYFVLRLLAVAH